MQILRVIEAYCSLSASTTNKQRHTFSTTSSKFLFLCIHLGIYFNNKVETQMMNRRACGFQNLWGHQYRVGIILTYPHVPMRAWNTI